MSNDTNHEIRTAAVQAIWTGMGRQAPEADALQNSADIMLAAYNVGRGVPRQTDKTVSPLCGPRQDIA